MPALTVQMEIQLSPPIVFYKWLPLQPADAIRYAEDGIELNIWFDLDCVGSFLAEQELSSLINVTPQRVKVSARKDVSGSLKAHIESNCTVPEADAVGKEYKAVGQAIHKLTLDRVNRLIEFAYAIKGQYWVQHLEFDALNPSQFFIQTKAIASFGDETKYRFYPDNTAVVRVGTEQTKHFITPEEWESAKDFVVGNVRSPMAERLLASARELASKGHNRTALIEAVCALEIKLQEFARKCDDRIICEQLQIRLETKGLRTLIGKVGLRGAFGLVIPITLNEHQMPSAILTQCQEAIDLRGTVVHGARRLIEDKALYPMLTAIEECCARFDVLIGDRNGNHTLSS